MSEVENIGAFFLIIFFIWDDEKTNEIPPLLDRRRNVEKRDSSASALRLSSLYSSTTLKVLEPRTAVSPLVSGHEFVSSVVAPLSQDFPLNRPEFRSPGILLRYDLTVEFAAFERPLILPAISFRRKNQLRYRATRTGRCT